VDAVDQFRPGAGNVEARSRKVVRGNVFEDAGLLLVDMELRD
jgi:hypothetical protein